EPLRRRGRAPLTRMFGLPKKAAGEAARRRWLESSPAGIWIQDAASLITFANPRLAEMLGATTAALVGRSVEDFYFPSDRSVERIRTEGLAAAPAQQFDRRLRRADGSEIWVLACSSVIGDGASLSLMIGITERKRAEQALRRSEQRFRDLFETVAEGFCETTPDGRILGANPTLVRMLGFSRESELKALNFTKDLCADPPARRRMLEQLEREGSLREIEYSLRTREGGIIHVEENARVVRDERGAIAGFESALTDITARRRMEEQLRAARKLEALGRLAGGIAHDFDAVLSFISTRIESALGELPSSHPARPSIEQAREAAKNAQALTGQLLAFTRGPAEPAARQTPSGSETILLVETDPLIRELSRDMLERQGYRVILAAEPAEAERVGAAARCDLLIAGFRMASMSGEELARRLRTWQPGLRVLFIAGYDDPPREGLDPALANSGFISRPFSADSLGRKVRQILTSD
ncbi:MAG TPA: PAS domain S-box protein, partial [Bryobacteraceae bacterium]|nr:PAS domain S-box protein [Bryobacteraceae bacterium]